LARRRHPCRRRHPELSPLGAGLLRPQIRPQKRQHASHHLARSLAVIPLRQTRADSWRVSDGLVRRVADDADAHRPRHSYKQDSFHTEPGEFNGGNNRALSLAERPSDSSPTTRYGPFWQSWVQFRVTSALRCSLPRRAVTSRPPVDRAPWRLRGPRAISSSEAAERARRRSVLLDTAPGERAWAEVCRGTACCLARLPSSWITSDNTK
jgi:hypothetical protein